jgi:hypothetical protein
MIRIGPGIGRNGERRETTNVLGDVARATAAALGLSYHVPQPAAAAIGR